MEVIYLIITYSLEAGFGISKNDYFSSIEDY